MNSSKALWVALIAVAIIAVGGYFFPQVAAGAFGNIDGPTTYGEIGTNALKIGASCGSGFRWATCAGTQINGLNMGQCYIQAYATTIAASSTAKVDCQATQAVGGITTALDSILNGVSTNDNVQATLATSTEVNVAGQGLVVVAASASTTPGFISLLIANNSGAVFTWPTIGNATGTVNYVSSR